MNYKVLTYDGPKWKYEKAADTSDSAIYATIVSGADLANSVAHLNIASQGGANTSLAALDDNAALDLLETSFNVLSPMSKINSEIEASGFAILLSPSVDLVDIGPAKLYVTGGAGISYIKLKQKSTLEIPSELKIDTIQNGCEPEMEWKWKWEWESKVRFAWSVGAGVAFEVSPGVSIDVGYSFTDLGKPAKEDFKELEIDGAGVKRKIKDKNMEFKGNNLRSHNVNVGVRFSL